VLGQSKKFDKCPKRPATLRPSGYAWRFTSADSIVPQPNDAQSFNRYAYVRNRPLSATDPSGHDDLLPPIFVDPPGPINIPGSGNGGGFDPGSISFPNIPTNPYNSSLPGIPSFPVGSPLAYLYYMQFIYGRPQLYWGGPFSRGSSSSAPAPAAAPPPPPIAAGFVISSSAYGYTNGSSIGRSLLQGAVNAVPGPYYSGLAQQQFSAGNYGAAGVTGSYGDSALN
jgi:hypothetical protein